LYFFLVMNILLTKHRYFLVPIALFSTYITKKYVLTF
jgi:hypothetical protein